MRLCRIELGLTQEELAERADLSKNYVGSIERGEQEMRVGIVIRLAGGLGMRASVLLERSGY